MPKVPLSIIIFSITFIGIAVGAVLITQTQNITFIRVLNPNLSLSTATLSFGTVTDNTLTPIATFTITNTGNMPLVLTYSVSGGNWPAWATLHLASMNYYNQGGDINLEGYSLATGAVLTVYPSLQIGQGSGPATDFSGTVFINGS